MSNITGGEVGYGRTVKTGDFENKRVDVKLAFTVGDGENHATILDAAAMAAYVKCHELLSLRQQTVGQAAVTSAGQVTSSSTQMDVIALAAANAAKAAAARNSRKPPKPDPQEGNDVDPQKSADAQKATHADAERPQAAVDADPLNIPAGLKRGEPVLPADPDGLDIGPDAAEAKPVTDEALQIEIQKVNARTRNPRAIRTLIGTYFDKPEGKHSQDIPQNLRQDFLKKLHDANHVPEVKS